MKPRYLEVRRKLYGESKTNWSKAIILIQPDSVIFFLKFILPHLKLEGKLFLTFVSVQVNLIYQSIQDSSIGKKYTEL